MAARLEIDLIDTLLHGTPADLGDVRESLRRSRNAHDNRLVIQAVREVEQYPDAISFDEQGWATVSILGRAWAGGRFTCPTIAELRAQAAARARAASGKVRLDVLSSGVFDEPLVDVGSFHALAAGRTLIQVASQFNTLEAPGPVIVPLSRYWQDGTQGPRSAIAGLPGLLVRHYRALAADGSRFEQRQDGPQIDLLADALPRSLGATCNGYLRADDIPGADRMAALRAAATALETHAERIRIGVHEELQVMLGHDFFGAVSGERRVGQVLTSAFALDYSDDPPRRAIPRPVQAALCRPLLRAAYTGTLLAAVAHDYPKVLLTLIGGGVFRNDLEWITAALCEALALVDPLVGDRLQVLVNCHTRSEAASLLEAEASNRGGCWVQLNR